jgi:hypothetical protein
MKIPAKTGPESPLNVKSKKAVSLMATALQI